MSKMLAVCVHMFLAGSVGLQLKSEDLFGSDNSRPMLRRLLAGTQDGIREEADNGNDVSQSGDSDVFNTRPSLRRMNNTRPSVFGHFRRALLRTMNASNLFRRIFAINRRLFAKTD